MNICWSLCFVYAHCCKTTNIRLGKEREKKLLKWWKNVSYTLHNIASNQHITLNCIQWQKKSREKLTSLLLFDWRRRRFCTIEKSYLVILGLHMTIWIQRCVERPFYSLRSPTKFRKEKKNKNYFVNTHFALHLTCQMDTNHMLVH